MNLVKKLRTLSMRNGVEISIEGEQENLLLQELEKKRFVRVNGRLINSADVVGIFSPEDMEATIRRKNGQWKDKKGNWHDKGERVCPKHPQNVLQYGQSCGLCS